MAKKKNCYITQENRKEIIYNLINGGLAGGLVFLGSLTTGQITREGLAVAFVASLIVFVTKFKEYWDEEKKEYSIKSTKLFNFY
jgi:hypothetical protein